MSNRFLLTLDPQEVPSFDTNALRVAAALATCASNILKRSVPFSRHCTCQGCCAARGKDGHPPPKNQLSFLGQPFGNVSKGEV